MNPSGCDQCGRQSARKWADTIPSAYGDEEVKYPRPMPVIVPCSTFARWYLAARRWLLG